MTADSIEQKMLDKVLVKLGYNPEEFCFEFVEDKSKMLPNTDKSLVDHMVWRVTRKNTEYSYLYNTGHNQVWPDDVEADLKAGKFSLP